MIALARSWPDPEDRLTVALNSLHPGAGIYARALKGRAELRLLPENESPAALLARPLAFLSSLFRLRRFVREEKPDVLILSTGGFPLTALTWRFLCAARLSAVPRIILAVHNYPHAKPGRLRGLYLGLFGRLALLLCNEVMAVSRDLAQNLERYNLNKKRPLSVILNGLEPRAPETSLADKKRALGTRNETLIGAIGNLEERKGFKHLVSSMLEILGEVPDAKLVIIGATVDAEVYGELLELISHLGLGEKVHLTGFTPDAGRYAECFSVCVIPSVARESFGLLALEAMRYKKPVVAARTGGIPEIVIDGETGLLVPAEDPGALARAILSLLKSPELSRKMGEAGHRRWLERFSAERMAREYRQLASRP